MAYRLGEGVHRQSKRRGEGNVPSYHFRFHLPATEESKDGRGMVVLIFCARSCTTARWLDHMLGYSYRYRRYELFMVGQVILYIGLLFLDLTLS